MPLRLKQAFGFDRVADSSCNYRFENLAQIVEKHNGPVGLGDIAEGLHDDVRELVREYVRSRLAPVPRLVERRAVELGTLLIHIIVEYCVCRTYGASQ